MDKTKAEMSRLREQDISALHQAAARLTAAASPRDMVFTGILARIRARRSEHKSKKSNSFSRLLDLGVSKQDIMVALTQTKSTGASLLQELIVSKRLDPEIYYRRMAFDLGIEFVTIIDASKILTDMMPPKVITSQISQLFCRNQMGIAILHTTPDYRSEAALIELIEREPENRDRIKIALPTTIEDAISVRFAANSVARSIAILNDEQPAFSAKQTFTPYHAFICGAAIVALPVAFTFAFWSVLLFLHVIASLLFGSSVLLRLMAFWSFKKTDGELCVDYNHRTVPLYSVIVALHDEASIVAQLVTALSALEWPKSRLQVLYVCEDDDNSTIDALHAQKLPPTHRIIRVPFALPRTKPKALTFALPQCAGEFVVIYDAEDRPHPAQLKEAWTRFSNEDKTLVCLQAPLAISNGSQSWWSRLFAFEYAAHFYGLLPYLARIGAPLPLGGTSNHFRRDALVKSLAWDPYNVTEDADLGIRFSRLGYRCGVITKPTLEDAPTEFKVWLPQRTRWQKGWMQTFLVHNRQSKQLFKVLGPRHYLIFQIILLGFILSPLLYVISVFELSALMFLRSQNSLEIDLILFLDVTLFVCGHIGFYCLATRCEAKKPLAEHLKMLLSLPFYWIFLSRAAWRAVGQLIFKPHLWEKTPHLPSVSSEVSDLAR